MRKKHEDSLTDLSAALRPMVIKKNQCCSVKAEKFNLLLVLKKPKSKKKKCINKNLTESIVNFSNRKKHNIYVTYVYSFGFGRRPARITITSK